MYLLNNAALPMTAKKSLLFEGLMEEESPQAMGGLLLTLVVLLHIGAFYVIKSLAPAEPAKPRIIMEVTMEAVPLPLADEPQPLPMVAPPPVIPPAPVPPPPKPIEKPKPVVKPKPKNKPKPVVHKTEPILIPVAEKPSPLPATPTPAPAPRPAPTQTKGSDKPQQAKFTPASGANYGYNPKPKYPSIARSRGWEGKVILSVRVSASGEVQGVSVSSSSGHDVLDDAAVSAVEGWRFVPAKRGDEAVASTVHVPINFRLD